jgi:hypothetical protein
LYGSDYNEKILSFDLRNLINSFNDSICSSNN